MSEKDHMVLKQCIRHYSYKLNNTSKTGPLKSIYVEHAVDQVLDWKNIVFGWREPIGISTNIDSLMI